MQSRVVDVHRTIPACTPRSHSSCTHMHQQHMRVRSSPQAINSSIFLPWHRCSQPAPHRAYFSWHARTSGSIVAAAATSDAGLEDMTLLEDEEDADELEELSEARHVIVEPDFLPAAQRLRAVFDERFEDPRRTHRERFLWDYWYVKGQYTLHRTQAQAYFPADLYEQLQDALLAYGEAQLGCRAITPIWMSYYIDGCSQDLHCDNPQGPFAYVLSLTKWDIRRFTGGETMILKPRVLNFWQGFQANVGLERSDLMTLVEPHFNQLTVFDPRFPHGVVLVRGTQDPQEARIVLHGWFTEPSPFFDGPLDEEAAAEGLNNALGALFEDLAELPAVTGTTTLRVTVSTAGSVTGVEFLADTLIVLPGADADSSTVRAHIQHTMRDHLLAATFPACADGDTQITLPIIFD